MTTQAANGTATMNNLQRSYIFPLIIIGALFFIFGFVTWANSQLIPYLKIACELTDTQSFLVAPLFLRLIL
jgi:fucose permease